jgi:hypothetical protein
MYTINSDGVPVLKDRREMLRVKLKSLAEEARIIRREERRTNGFLREELHDHRVKNVRQAARNTHLAYGFIRGRTWEQMEATYAVEPDWDSIDKMLGKYGPFGNERLHAKTFRSKRCIEDMNPGVIVKAENTSAAVA